MMSQLIMKTKPTGITSATSNIVPDPPTAATQLATWHLYLTMTRPATTFSNVFLPPPNLPVQFPRLDESTLAIGEPPRLARWEPIELPEVEDDEFPMVFDHLEQGETIDFIHLDPGEWPLPPPLYQDADDDELIDPLSEEVTHLLQAEYEAVDPLFTDNLGLFNMDLYAHAIEPVSQPFLKG